MGKKVERLSARRVETATKAGYHADGAGLYLQVTAAGSKSWIYRYSRKGKAHEMGLGRYPFVSLVDARGKRHDQQKLLAEGKDPLEQKQRAREEQEAAEIEEKRERDRAKTFRYCAEKCIEAKRPGWKNAKHAAQWTSTLETFAFPIIGDKAVADVDTDLIEQVLAPIWAEKTETATRVRGRIETVLSWAIAKKFRAGPNPAAWRGNLKELMADPRKLKAVQHHPALPFAQIPDFIITLRSQEGIASRALEFCILTATRTSEVLGAKWAEFDLDVREWIVPAGRMKMKREHRVPLSPRAVVIVEEMRQYGSEGYVFPGAKADRPLSTMSMLMTLRRMDRADLTVHGFRSSFRDWASECTNVANEVCESALAHTIRNAAEAAYRRGNLFEKRRGLMDQWARFCSGQGATGKKVVALRGSARAAVA